MPNKNIGAHAATYNRVVQFYLIMTPPLRKNRNKKRLETEKQGKKETETGIYKLRNSKINLKPTSNYSL